jgi:hypothetical protein
MKAGKPFLYGPEKNLKKCFLIGYSNILIHYRLWNSSTKEVFTATDIVFNKYRTTALEEENATDLLLEENSQNADIDVWRLGKGSEVSND